MKQLSFILPYKILAKIYCHNFDYEMEELMKGRSFQLIIIFTYLLCAKFHNNDYRNLDILQSNLFLFYKKYFLKVVIYY